jgi:putative transposase
MGSLRRVFRPPAGGLKISGSGPVLGPEIGDKALYNECVTRSHITHSDNTRMSRIFHPLLALIASATDRELAKYVEYLKEENKILRARLPKQVHTKPHERERLIALGKALGRAIEELMTIVSPATFYRWLREDKETSPKKNPKGGQRKPREIRELVIEIAKTTGFGYTQIYPYCPPMRSG